MAESFANNVKAASDTVSTIYKATAKSSLTRMSKDLICQIPIAVSGGIDSDELFPLLKCFEKNYASILFTVISAEGEVNRDKYKTIADFIRRFHNNDDFILKFSGATEGYEIESAIATEGYLSEEDSQALWNLAAEGIDTTSINDIYTPFKRTESKLAAAIESAQTVAMESDLFYREITYKKNKTGVVIKDQRGNPIVEMDNGHPVYDYKRVLKPVESDVEVKTLDEWRKEDPMAKPVSVNDYRSKVGSKASTGEILKDDKYNAMTPTMVKITLVNTKKDSNTWSQELLLGVKVMPRVMKPSVMISNVVEAFKDRKIFTFIKWTKGEQSAADILFGASSAKAAATAGADRRWLKLLRKRSRNSKMARVFGKSINPNYTIMITDAEAYEVKRQCGIDPYDTNEVRKMMDKYFLLCFAIYDSEAKMLNVLYDGDEDFTQYSLRSIIADSKKETNLLTMNKF